MEKKTLNIGRIKKLLNIYQEKKMKNTVIKRWI